MNNAMSTAGVAAWRKPSRELTSCEALGGYAGAEEILGLTGPTMWEQI